MKKFIFILLMTGSVGVMAEGHHEGYRHHEGHHGGGQWVAPLIGGIAAGALIGGIYHNGHPHYAQPPVTYQPNYGAPYGYHYETIYDTYCGCYKSALVPN